MSYWNIKVYDSSGEERETLRGLTYATMNTLMQIFEREGVEAQAQKYDDEGEEILDSEYHEGGDRVEAVLDSEDWDDMETLLKVVENDGGVKQSIRATELRTEIQEQRSSW